MQSPKLQFGLRAVFLAVTALGCISAVFPLAAVMLFAFSGTIFGLFIVHHGAKTADDTCIGYGIAVLTAGYFIGALLFMVMARFAG